MERHAWSTGFSPTPEQTVLLFECSFRSKEEAQTDQGAVSTDARSKAPSGAELNKNDYEVAKLFGWCRLRYATGLHPSAHTSLHR